MGRDQQTSEIVRFGGFTFDQRTLELRRGSEIVALPPKPSLALAVLVRNAGSLVTREELHSEAWQGAVIELDHALNTCIRELRAVLGDSAERPTFIETVPRRGYRFVAAVEPAERSFKLGRPHWFAASALVVLSVGLVIQQRARPADSEPLVLAVLPLEAIGAEEDRLFAEGLTEELLTGLSAADPGRLRVLARTSASRIAETFTIADMRSRLAVDYLVEGSVRRELGGHRVAIRLVDTRTATTQWSGQQHFGAATGWIATQERLSHQIVRAVSDSIGLHLESPPTSRPIDEVARAWWIGRHLVSGPGDSERQRAVELLEAVIAADPTFVPARAALVRGLLDLDRREAAEIALARAPEGAERAPALLLERGRLRLRQWRLEEAGEDLAAAVAGAPYEPRAHHAHAYYLSVTGRHCAASRAMERAQDLDPVSESVVGDAGLFAFWARNPELAARRCEEIRPYVLPRFEATIHRCLLHNYVALEAWDRALHEARALMISAGASESELSSLRASGSPSAALRGYFAWAADPVNFEIAQGGTSSFRRALAAATANDVEGALRALEQALAEREPRLIEIGVEPRLDRLRHRPRFQAIERVVGVQSVSAQSLSATGDC